MTIAELYKTIAPVGPGAKENTKVTPKPTPGVATEFEKILQQSKGPEKKAEHKVNLSQHAETRIKSRAIPWDANMEKRINRGIDAAEAKGSRDALILADNVAFIANVKSRTIVTAMDRQQMKEKVFTNIDSAILV